eukprot:jgi/Antlo1/1745/1539
MDPLLKKITELQCLKVESIKSLGADVTAEATRQFPMFTVRNTSQGPVACINSTNWEFAVFQLKEHHASVGDCEKRFQDIEKMQLEAFETAQRLLSVELPVLVKLLGENICTAIVCELGSLKRLAEIPSKNLKGIGYFKSSFYSQRSYLSHHPLVLSAQGTKAQNRKLRMICRMVSIAAKLCYFGGNTDLGNLRTCTKKAHKKHNTFENSITCPNTSKTEKKRKRKRGPRRRKKRFLAAEEKHADTKTAYKEEIAENTLSIECDTSTE